MGVYWGIPQDMWKELMETLMLDKVQCVMVKKDERSERWGGVRCGCSSECGGVWG